MRLKLLFTLLVLIVTVKADIEAKQQRNDEDAHPHDNIQVPFHAIPRPIPRPFFVQPWDRDTGFVTEEPKPKPIEPQPLDTAAPDNVDKIKPRLPPARPLARPIPRPLNLGPIKDPQPTTMPPVQKPLSRPTPTPTPIPEPVSEPQPEPVLKPLPEPEPTTKPEPLRTPYPPLLNHNPTPPEFVRPAPRPLPDPIPKPQPKPIPKPVVTPKPIPPPTVTPKPIPKPTVIPKPSNPKWVPSRIPNLMGDTGIAVDYKCARDGFYKVDNECDSYIECQKDSALKYICYDGLIFNKHARWPEFPCVYPSDEVQCEYGEVIHDPQPTAECPRQYGLFAIKDSDCSRYISCQEGLATIMSCPPGLVFNDKKSACDWPVNVPNCDPKVFKSYSCPPSPVDEFGEPYDLIYKYRYGKSCKEYVACQRGHPRLLSCDAGLAFDEDSQTCVGSDYVANCSH